MRMRITQAEMEQRWVQYADLQGCRTAFLDTRTPGSEEKENFTIIGPGVAENPEQHVHISIPHGFNIGGARQPPRCLNSQHSHESAEVFIVHTGTWRFLTGHDAKGAYIDLGPGDTISIPVHVFRGFENVGNDVGFMFAVLGGDDPGRVTWAPQVFEAAARYGLVLLENGQLVDTAKESLAADARRMPITTAADLAKFRVLDAHSLAACVSRASELSPGGGLTVIPGFEECPIIGDANLSEQMPAGRLNWAHPFQLRALRLAARARSPLHIREEEEVLLVHEGQPHIEWPGGRLDMGPGDTLTVPKGLERAYANDHAERAIMYVVRGGNHPAQACWIGDEVA